MPWKKSEPMGERMEFGVRAMRALNFRALCQQYGISAKTGYKWKERFIREGLEGMVEESRRPKSTPGQLPEEEVCEIVSVNINPQSVTHVLTQKCYRCPDCTE